VKTEAMIYQLQSLICIQLAKC